MPTGVQNGTGRLKGLEIQDLAPAIIKILDLPIPGDMEGKVISRGDLS